MKPTEQHHLNWRVLSCPDGLPMLQDLLPLLEDLLHDPKPDARFLDDPGGTGTGIQVTFRDAEERCYKVSVHLDEDDLIEYFEDRDPEWRLNRKQRLELLVQIAQDLVHAEQVFITPEGREELYKAAILRAAAADGGQEIWEGNHLSGTVKYMTPLGTGGAYIHSPDETTFFDHRQWEQPGPVHITYVQNDDPEESEEVIITAYGTKMEFTVPNQNERDRLDQQLSDFIAGPNQPRRDSRPRC